VGAWLPSVRRMEGAAGEKRGVRSLASNIEDQPLDEFCCLLAFNFNRDKIMCAFFVYIMVEGPQRGTILRGNVV